VVSFAEPIWASGQVPRQQAGHMTAIAPFDFSCKSTLAPRGPSTHGTRWFKQIPSPLTSCSRPGTIGSDRSPPPCGRR